MLQGSLARLNDTIKGLLNYNYSGLCGTCLCIAVYHKSVLGHVGCEMP